MASINDLFPPKEEDKKKESISTLFPPKEDEIVAEESFTVADLANLPEIGSAPELNQLSMPAFRASFGLLASGDDSSAKAVLQQQFPESTFESVDGYTIANLPSGEYVLNKPGISGQDIAKFAFNMAAFTPAAMARSITGAAIGSAATEYGLGELESFVGGEEATTGEVLTSGLLGGGFKSAEEAISAAYRAYKGGRPQEADEIIKAANEQGIPISTSDVLEPQTFSGRMAQQTGEKIPLAGTGGFRETQQIQRELAVDDVIEKYGEYSYEAIVKSLKDKKDKILSSAGGVLESTGSKLDNAGVVDISNARQAISEVKEELSKPGVIKSGTALEDLQVLVNALDEAPQSFTSLKENLTAFRDILQGFDKAERSQLGTRAKGLLTKVQSVLKQDQVNFAKENLDPKEFAKWQRANQVWADESRKLTKTKIKGILDKGDFTPEQAQTMIFSKRPSEVKSIYNALGSTGRSNARSAIISKIANDLSKRKDGITPNAFANEMKKYQSQIDTFFKDSDKKQLKGLLKALDATKRAQDAAVTTPTGQSLIGIGSAYALFTDLLTTAGIGGTVGGLSRIYESKPVRDALLKISSVPRGSTDFEKTLNEAVTALSAATQSERRTVEEVEKTQ